MSDTIPFEMQVEILKKLPVKQLIRFRSVSKTWKNLIDSSHFIALYSKQHAQMEHLLISFVDPDDIKHKYVSIVDDDTFPKNNYFTTAPLLANMLMLYRTIGSSHGLFCIFGVYPRGRRGPYSKTNMVVLWNPSIKKAVAAVVPNVAYGNFETVLGFGVCRETNDPKIVKITHIMSCNDLDSITHIPYQVEVFTLSTGVWRSSYSNLPRKSIQFGYYKIVLDGILYWLATDRITMDGRFRSCNLIISFDMTSEEFREIQLPDRLTHESRYNLSMFKPRESLVVIEGIEINIHVYLVWKMEDGVSKLFTQQFVINVNVSVNTRDQFGVRGIRISGEPIIEIWEDNIGIYKLLVYEPSKHIDDLGIEGLESSFSVYPYTESLLLLDQPNIALYNERETVKFLDDLVSYYP